MTTESHYKKELADWLTSVGAWHYAVMSRGYGASGVPDRCGVIKGRGFAVEVKMPGKTPTALQFSAMRACVQSGGVAIIYYPLGGVPKSVMEREGGWKISQSFVELKAWFMLVCLV